MAVDASPKEGPTTARLTVNDRVHRLDDAADVDRLAPDLEGHVDLELWA